eukprot:TRINITY_DN699_c0_g1_i3.p1 TRINITY_DN699_c0_g1~~TRINITY_DN699_c0_g1_i3.p1  ORF type:complete len:288 (-),score=29.04 TRINITY_DN699_c0_g1_i3:378-1241(-)
MNGTSENEGEKRKDGHEGHEGEEMRGDDPLDQRQQRNVRPRFQPIFDEATSGTTRSRTRDHVRSIFEDNNEIPHGVSFRSSFTCHFCLEVKPISVLAAHSHRCERAHNKLLGLLPICGCNSCLGTRSHNGDEVDGSFLDPRSGMRVNRDPIQGNQPVVTPSPATVTRPRNLTLPQLPRQDPLVNPPQDQLSNLKPEQYEGGICAFCSPDDMKKVKKTVLPAIRMGKYRTFGICKKEHFTTEGQRMILLVDHVLEAINKNGDLSPNQALNQQDPTRDARACLSRIYNY